MQALKALKLKKHSNKNNNKKQQILMKQFWAFIKKCLFLGQNRPNKDFHKKGAWVEF